MKYFVIAIMLLIGTTVAMSCCITTGLVIIGLSLTVIIMDELEGIK